MDLYRKRLLNAVKMGHGKVVCMNLLLYGSLAMVAFSKPWRAAACNFLDVRLRCLQGESHLKRCLKHLKTLDF